jgi:hypothetical protein
VRRKIDVQGTMTPAANTALNVNNPNGVNLINNLSLAAGCLRSGNVNTGARTLTLSAMSVTGAGAGHGLAQRHARAYRDQAIATAIRN